MLAALLLEGVYLAREIEVVGKALAVLGVLLALWMAYKGVARLRRAERRPDGTLQRRATLGRWAGGAVLVLPATLLVVLPVVDFVGTRYARRAYQAQLLARQRLFTADYELDLLASPPGMRWYRFDLSLRPDSTFELRTSVPHTRPYSTGRWRVAHPNSEYATYEVRLMFAQGDDLLLYTQDLTGASWLERSTWPASESFRLRKRFAAR